ncbi:hypothetical protein L6R44_23575 [Enterobacter cloacae complex sp. ECC445]|uniref:hypothetical protein n=1 Tax=Enterobacteriaceae TaxID=543 RepID=UPI001F3C429B|nr:hypothetical protein [Enterobacter cloacae complex sp. ECC445]EMD4493653.1 hypothetical protein [Salmonella enterica]MCG0459052.1 hypothetical protein [Enterobacter cloacae complex sp. ECC445]HCW0179193.1 hypothetical protein [Citrobacter freundii]
MKAINEQPDARELVDRSRVLVRVMLENPDEVGPNFVMLLILRDQLQMLHDVFEEAEVRRLRDDKLPL